MFRTLFVWLSFASAGASRIQTHSQAQAETQFPFGASCENLQNRFHNQVRTLRVAIDARTSESVVTQARLAMRTHGMIRTLRRAQECDWVVENNSEDIEEMRGIMQDLLAGNPCAEAARSELDAGASSEENAALGRAMLILMSDNCEVPEIQPVDDTQTPEADLQQAEEGLQDRIDEIMDADEEEGESFIQSDQTGRFQRFMRGLGVFFLMLFLLLACVAAVAAIVAVLAAAVFFIYMAIEGLLLGHALGAVLAASTTGWGAVFILLSGYYAAIGSLPVGVVGCGYQLYNTALPGSQSALPSSQ